jgi:hydrogenase-4 component F
MTVELLAIFPLVPVVTGLAMLGVSDRRILAAIDVAGSLVVLLLAIVVAEEVAADGQVSVGVLRADALTVPFLLLIGALALATSIYTIGWMKGELETGGVKPGSLRFYYALVHAFIATMLVTVLADNLGVLWIAMEGTTITSAVLVGFHGNQGGLEAAWKYIIVTTIGISLGLFGTILVYAAAAAAQGGSSAGAMNWSTIAGMADRLDPGIVRIGFIFVMVGYGTKAGLAPVHRWLPDAHSQAPTPVSALLSGALIKCALYGIIRFHVIARGACGPELSADLFVLFGLASVVVATPFILAQHDLKRLLAYSSVEHVGIIALGLGFGGRVGTYGALLHTVNHGVTKALGFFGAGTIIGRYRSRDLTAIRGVLAAAPWLGTLFFMGAFALTGLPPFSIFISELTVVRAGIGAGHPVLVFVVLLMLIAVFSGLLFHAGRMLFGAPPAGLARGSEPRSPVFAMLLLAALMLLLGLSIPPALDGILSRATEVILG